MEAGVAKWLHRTAGPYALGTFLRLTEVKSGHDWCHCLDIPETRVLCRVQKHQCRSTRHLLQLKSGTRSARLASSQPGEQQSMESSACTFMLLVQRVTSCPAVVESSDPTKPPLQLGHPAQRCQHLFLANPGGCRCRLPPPQR